MSKLPLYATARAEYIHQLRPDGIGFDRTRLKVIADPALRLNTHYITIRGRTGEAEDSGFLLMAATNENKIDWEHALAKCSHPTDFQRRAMNLGLVEVPDAED